MFDLLRLWFVLWLLWGRCYFNPASRWSSNAMHTNTLWHWIVFWWWNAEYRATAELHLSVLQEDGLQRCHTPGARLHRAHRDQLGSSVSTVRWTSWRRAESSHRWFCGTSLHWTSYGSARVNLFSNILFKSNFSIFYSNIKRISIFTTI